MENMLSAAEVKVKSIFRNKNFILLFIGKLVSQLGDVIYNMAIGWYILTITHSAAQMSIYMAIGTVVYIVMAPIGGVIADRISRKAIIIWADILRGIIVAITGVLMYAGIESIYLLYLTSILLSIGGALFVPASNAMIPNIVDDAQLTKANSMGGSVQSIANIAGLIAGGILYAVMGIKGIFILNAISYIVCGILEVFIILPDKKARVTVNNTDEASDRNEENVGIYELEAAAGKKKGVFKELAGSYSFMRSQKGMFRLMWVSTFMNFILVPLFAIFVPFIFNQILKTSTEQYSYVGAASAVGFLIGAAVLSLIPQKDKINKSIKTGMIAFSILFIFLYLSVLMYFEAIISRNIVIVSFIIIFCLIGIANAIINIPVGVVIQRIIPNEMLGKITALLNTLIMAAMPLGMLVGGAAVDMFSMSHLMLGTIIVFIMITVYTCIQKDIKEI